MRVTVDKAIQALALVRLGQELGTDSNLARAVACLIDIAASPLASFLRSQF